MLFHTWPFLIFLAVVLPVFFALRKTRLWLPWLTIASYFFYGWWNPYYLLLVLSSTLLDFFLVAFIDHCPRGGAGGDPGGGWRRRAAPGLAAVTGPPISRMDSSKRLSSGRPSRRPQSLTVAVAGRCRARRWRG